MSTRKVCIVTGTRAEYGLLKPLVDMVAKDSAFKLQLVVTGAHLSPEFGSTINEIEADGILVDEKIEMLLSSDTAVGVGKSMGLALIGFVEAFSRLQPDIIVILGDRYEILCAASAALVCKIPVAHLHGGELTEGAYDESIRHAVTKLSHVHFAATEVYRRRIIQMGEAPESVHNVGAIGLDNIRNITLLKKHELQNQLDVQFGEHNVLVTFHPVTLESMSTEAQISELLQALDEFPELFIIFTKANADNGGRIINRILQGYVEKNCWRAALFSSLGQLRYLSLMQMCDAVVGNSSSGIIEAPSLKVPTVNIGDRQKGRVRAESVIDCGCSTHEIVSILHRAFEPSFKDKVKSCTNPYGEGGAARRIGAVLRKCDLQVKKNFYDISV